MEQIQIQLDASEVYSKKNVVIQINKCRQCFFQFKVEFVIVQWVQTVLLAACAEWDPQIK